MLTILLIIAGIFAGFYALILLGAIALGWLVQPMVDGFYLNKKYRQAASLKVLVYVLLALAAGIALLALSPVCWKGRPGNSVAAWTQHNICKFII